MTSIVEQLLDELDNTREQLLVTIEPLPDEALLAPGVIGEWSVADLLVHLTVWESEMVTALMRLDQGKKPGRLLAALANIEEYNRKRFEENKGRDLDRVFDDWQQVRLQLEEWLAQFSEPRLANKKQYKWLKGRSLAQVVAQTTFENEKKYLNDVKKYAQKWSAPVSEQRISLTAVSVEDTNDDNESN